MKVLHNGDLSDFQRGQIVGTCLTRASVTKPATLLDVSNSSSFQGYDGTSSAKKNNGQKPNLSTRNCHTLKRIDCKNDRTSAAKVTAKLNIYPEDAVSTKRV